MYKKKELKSSVLFREGCLGEKCVGSAGSMSGVKLSGKLSGSTRNSVKLLLGGERGGLIMSH